MTKSFVDEGFSPLLLFVSVWEESQINQNESTVSHLVTDPATLCTSLKVKDVNI